MAKFFNTSIDRLRLLGFLEGLSLILLVLIAVPMKYAYGDPSLVKSLGPVHGGLFMLFVFYVMRVSLDQEWKFMKTTWQVLASCLIPFANFYIDAKILAPLQKEEE